ncbi:CAAX amino terminal protease self- immunity [Anaerohalosphaera lusitana]|uniref:CAAX amino terminal protease self-immunity n=2 Tax=Anaerohalosphaera lusitana TaxID=1936003 RepID=A0A1U9NJQ0_9BACT|nr:CAAX amino terminal protease self- immunity [Anaerohalosphaera lusitana]
MGDGIRTSALVRERAGAGVPFRAFWPFLVIAFAIAWGVLALYIFLPEWMGAVFGELSGRHPLFFLAVYAPAIAAVVVVLWHSGPAGLRGFMSRVLLWRCSWVWYAFLVVGIPLVFVGGAAMRGTLFTDPFAFDSVGGMFAGLGLAVIKGPMEEFGWRGVALPLLQRKFAPIWAGVVLGMIWGVWHLPAFLLSGTQQSEWAFAPFFLGCIALSVIVTPLFNASGGSILLTALFHFTVMNPVLPAAEPYDTYILVVAAGVIVWLNREAMFRRGVAVTEVVGSAFGSPRRTKGTKGKFEKEYGVASRRLIYAGSG